MFKYRLLQLPTAGRFDTVEPMAQQSGCSPLHGEPAAANTFHVVSVMAKL
jgi:hypothetical protein